VSITTVKPIATRTFTTALVEHGSWGGRALGEHESTMELFHDEADPLRGYIEWDIPALETGEGIGLTYELMPDGRRELVEYDGIMSLPLEAKLILESVGIVVGEDMV